MFDLLGEDADGYWAATSGGLVCPRQNGKGAVIEALELAWLFLCDVELIFHSAHLFMTAADAFRRIKTLIQNTPDLNRQVRRYSEAHGQEGIELHTGQRLRFVARSKSGGRGFPAPVVVLDEAFNLSQQAMAALVPTMAAQDNPFLLVTSSAPIADPCSDVLRSFMRRSRSGEVDRRCYIEYAAQPDADEETQLRQANPGYQVRLNDDVIDEERELLTADAFRVERLGLVELETEDLSWRVVPADRWTLCADAGHAPTDRLAYALDVDVNAKGETWAAVAASDGTHAELVTPPEAQAGLGWVVSACIAKRDVLGSLVLDKSGPAGELIVPLENAGITVRPVKPDEFAQACAQLLTDISAATFRHIDQPALNRAAAGAEKRDIGDGAWRWSRNRSTVDISPLVAVTLAKWAAGALNGPSVYEGRSLLTLG